MWGGGGGGGGGGGVRCRIGATLVPSFLKITLYICYRYDKPDAADGDVICYGQQITFTTLPNEGGQVGVSYMSLACMCAMLLGRCLTL